MAKKKTAKSAGNSKTAAKPAPKTKAPAKSTAKSTVKPAAKPAPKAAKPAPKPVKTKAKAPAPSTKPKSKSKSKAAAAEPALAPVKSSGLNLAQGTGLKIKVRPHAIPAPTETAAPKPVVKPVPKPDNGQDLDAPALTDDDLRKIKTGLSKKDLEHYAALLIEKRTEILGDVESLQTDAKNDGGNLSNMPLHMADVGSDNYEQEFTLGLVESERKLIGEINAALLRIKGGTYGVCIVKGVPINRARLDVTPWAKLCIEAARELERRSPRR